MKPMRIVVLHGATGDAPDEIDTLQTAYGVAASLQSQGHTVRIQHISSDPATLRSLTRDAPDMVFNLVDAVDGSTLRAIPIPEKLARLGLPFTGCDGRATRLCSSKTSMKQRIRIAGLPTPLWSLSGRSVRHCKQVIVKSVTEHASIGLDAQSVVPGSMAVAEISARQMRFDGKFFAEEFVSGREFNISMIEGPNGPEVLPAAEIMFDSLPPDAPHILDYAAKWDSDSDAYAATPRRFGHGSADHDLLATLRLLSLQAWRLFGLSGYARVDFRVDAHGWPWILEVNTNPCLASDAGLAAAANMVGISYDALIARILSSGLGRTARPDNPAPLYWYSEPDAGDPARIGQLVSATGMFSQAEVDIAADLASERQQTGTASGYEFILARQDDALAGYACYGPVPGSETAWDLYWIAVAPEQQGHGLGRDILTRVEAAVHRAGGRNLYIDTSTSAVYSATRSFYTRRGYRLAAEFPDFYRDGDGKAVYVRDLRAD